ncbi:MAG TPA: hypothetical protein VM260_22865, partial [Pirellula sp.]|nr:hypothetical protein [Pirellula sp.]
QIKNGFANVQYELEKASIIDVTYKVLESQPNADFSARKGAYDSMNKQIEDLDRRHNVNQHFEPAALPPIKERAIGPAEAALKAQLNGIDKVLGDSFKVSYDKAFTELNGVLNALKEVPNVNIPGKEPIVDPAKLEDKTKKTTDNLQALQSRFLARGPSNDPQREMAMTLKRLEDLQKQQIAVIRERLENPWQRADLSRLSGDNRNKLEVELIA